MMDEMLERSIIIVEGAFFMLDSVVFDIGEKYIGPMGTKNKVKYNRILKACDDLLEMVNDFGRLIEDENE